MGCCSWAGPGGLPDAPRSPGFNFGSGSGKGWCTQGFQPCRKHAGTKKEACDGKAGLWQDEPKALLPKIIPAPRPQGADAPAEEPWVLVLGEIALLVCKGKLRTWEDCVGKQVVSQRARKEVIFH